MGSLRLCGPSELLRGGWLFLWVTWEDIGGLYDLTGFNRTSGASLLGTVWRGGLVEARITIISYCCSPGERWWWLGRGRWRWRSAEVFANRMCLKVKPIGCPGELQVRCVRRRRANDRWWILSWATWGMELPPLRLKKTMREVAFHQGEAGKEHWELLEFEVWQRRIKR